MDFPSQLVARAVDEIAKLPGIGKKTALRLVLHLLRQSPDQTHRLADALTILRDEIQYCDTCHIIADIRECTCRTVQTDTSIVCVVEDTPDVLAIRNTGQYKGMFHVLGGRVSPIDGIGPDDLKIESLVKRIEASNGEIKEVILALSGTMEGETTAFYLTRRLDSYPLKITSIARGIPVGGELEFADELTLGRSISSRTEYHPTE